MDIAALSIGMSQNVVNTAASIALLKMQMNTGEETSNNLLEMAKTMAVEPGKGISLDQYV